MNFNSLLRREAPDRIWRIVAATTTPAEKPRRDARDANASSAGNASQNTTVE